VAAMLCLGALVTSTHAFDPLSQASHRVEPLSRALHRDRWDWNCEFCSSPRAILSLSEADGRPLLSLACLLTVCLAFAGACSNDANCNNLGTCDLISGKCACHVTYYGQRCELSESCLPLLTNHIVD
jgi:hypothetical protein